MSEKKIKDETNLESEVILSTDLPVIPFAELQDSDQVVDVRTPAEFDENSLPGAVNIPIFDNYERSVIGTMYKQIGRDEAIQQGFEFISPKLDGLIADFTPYRDKRIVVSCARGGMRSRAVVNLLKQVGFHVAQLQGGYKDYRQAVIDVVENYEPDMIILHGMTGVGKTRLIEKLSPAMDLEGMARHRSSLFGALDRIPSNQKTFEAELYNFAVGDTRPLPFVEGESRKIGEVFIPSKFADAMKRARMVLITASIETRIRRIIEDYPMEDPAVRKKAGDIIRTLRQRLGGDTVEHLCDLLERDELEEFVRILLVDYYDKRYGNSMRSYDYDLTIDAEDIDATVAQLQTYRDGLLL